MDVEAEQQANSGDESSGGDVGAGKPPKKPDSGSDSGGLGTRQLMLAGLAPTIALVGVLVGILVGVYADRVASERADKIRVAELILPRYEAAVDAIYDFEYGIDDCMAAADAYGDTPEGDPLEAERFAELENLCDVELFVKAEALDVALGQALLVSSPELQEAALVYGVLSDEVLELTLDWTFAETESEAQEIEEEFFAARDQMFETLREMRNLVNEQQIFATES